MLKLPTKYLLLVNGLLWTAIGIKILLIGEDYYGRLEGIPWWYFLLSAVVFAGFWFMFTGVVRKYAARIMAMPEPRTSVFKTFSVKGYLIIAFMITLGIVLKNIPQVPDHSSPGSTAVSAPGCSLRASASSSAGGRRYPGVPNFRPGEVFARRGCGLQA